MNYGKCENCSKPLRGRRSDAVTCSPACAQAMRRARRNAIPLPEIDVSGIETLAEYADRLRLLSSALLAARGQLTASEARWHDVTLRLLRALDHLDEVALAENQAGMVYELILRTLGAFGVAADDPRIREVMPGLIREMTEPDAARSNGARRGVAHLGDITSDAGRKMPPPHEIPLPDPDKAGG